MIPHAGSLVLQRRLRIADAIRREGSVRVDTLSERLGVSAVTIRGDLAYLEAQGMVLRGAGHARALPGPLPRMPPDGNDAASPRPPPPALLRAARALVPDGGTVLLGPGPAALRLLPLLADVANLTLLLIALDAVPVARACTNAALHLVGGALDANGVLGGPQALASLLLHPVSLFVVEADGIRNDAATLHGLSPGHGEAFATGAAERAARTAVLLTGRG
ncbi:MAG: DeoR/GlpR transcriptional regulator, partial [Gluconacetobacter diazotrophicus]|nr:DeoR/GlpR transcriptional regulator [Gluconacetobacter diazotrophicus]